MIISDRPGARPVRRCIRIRLREGAWLDLYEISVAFMPGPFNPFIFLRRGETVVSNAASV